MQNIYRQVSFTFAIKCSAFLEGKGSKHGGIDRQPIFIPSTWSTNGSCDVSNYCIPDTRTILPSVYVQVTSQQMVNLGISLTKELKDLYTENYKILLKEILKDTSKLKDNLC